MALIKSTLSTMLEDVLTQKPSSSDAAQGWADAYVSFASPAMSSVSSLATNAQGNASILQGAFSGAFASQTSAGAAAAIAGGVKAFWMAIVWSGPSAVGTTLVPGNFTLIPDLVSIFDDTEEKSESDKASALADAFETGAKMVTVNDILTSTGVPVIGPIS